MSIAVELDREAAAYLGPKDRRLSVHRNTSRDDEILMMRESGAKLEEIGAAFGVTRERIRQLLERQGYTKTRSSDVDPIAILKAARADGVTNMRAAARACGIDIALVSKVVRELGVGPALQRLYRWRRQAPQRRNAVARLRAFGEKYGRSPFAAEIGFKARTPKHPDLQGVSSALPLFASLGTMFEAAGLVSRKRGTPGHQGPRRKAPPRPRCRNGHEYTDANTYMASNGRRCRTCIKLARK